MLMKSETIHNILKFGEFYIENVYYCFYPQLK